MITSCHAGLCAMTTGRVLCCAVPCCAVPCHAVAGHTHLGGGRGRVRGESMMSVPLMTWCGFKGSLILDDFQSTLQMSLTCMLSRGATCCGVQRRG